MPKKPHKWGYKVYVLSGVSGFAYDMEVYSGKQDNSLIDGETDCGASSNVVVRLCRCVPDHQNYKVYFDNYFNSPNLQICLLRRGIHSLGTIRVNRVSQSNLMSDNEMKKKGRGTITDKIATIRPSANEDGMQLSLVKWYDNRAVTFLSSFVGSEPVGEIKRWCKVKKKEISISCPKVVEEYNKHMGGVDLLDSLTGLYRTKIRSKKWYHKMFFHLLDQTVVNAWLLYRRAADSSDSQDDVLRLHDFKAAVADGLCREGKLMSSTVKSLKKRGRPSEAEEVPPVKKCRISTTARPAQDITHDHIDHWPLWERVRQRCKMPMCKGFTYVQCGKCKLHLCFTSKKNCFYDFHNH